MMGKKKKKSTLTTLYRQFWLVSRDLECTLNPELDIKERNTINAKVEKCLTVYKMISLVYLMI